MLKREQPGSIEEYSSALRERLAGVLPPDKVEEVVAETECHLEERADELRRRADVYEKQAVAEFIPPRKLAWGINRAWAATYLRHGGTKWLQGASAALSIFALLLFMAQFLMVTKLPLLLQDSRFVLNFLFTTPVIVFVLAVLACRPQIRRFTYGGVASVILFGTLGGWLCTVKGTGYVSRFDAPVHYKSTLAMHLFHQKEARLLRDGIRFYKTVFSPLEVQISKNSNARLFAKLQQLKTAKYSHTTPTSYMKQLQDDILLARQQTVGGGLRYWWVYPSLTPASLMVGSSYVVPQTQAEQQGSSVFRKLSPAVQQSIYSGNVRMGDRSQALIEAWQKVDPESTASQTEALVRWHSDAPKHLEELQSRAAYRQKTLQGYMAIMASSKWRFEIPAARLLGIFGLCAVGLLLAADTLGGFLGMFLLRNLRRRKLRQGHGTEA